MAVDVPCLAEIIMGGFDEIGQCIVIGAVVFFNAVHDFFG